MGPNVNAFEKDLEAFDNSRTDGSQALDRKVVCLSAGKAAVHLALIGCGVGLGDEVLVQSYTFCASSHPITYLGAKPIFVGSEAETWNMDPELLEKAILDRKAVTGKYPKAIVNLIQLKHRSPVIIAYQVNENSSYFDDNHINFLYLHMIYIP